MAAQSNIPTYHSCGELKASDSRFFYLDLEGFADFERLSEGSLFRSVPGDWFLVITDIQGSTAAIEAGRYKDVNLIGAAAIAVVQTIFTHADGNGKDELAFVFGGDGATFLVPSHFIDSVKLALQGLKAKAIADFSLDLRIGVVAVSEIHAAGQPIEIAKFSITKGKSTALIRGGGLSWAEYQVKTFPRKFCLPAKLIANQDPYLGLSCRWQPLDSRNGVILAILARPRLLDSTVVFEKVLLSLTQILGGSLSAANPVQIEQMKYKNLWQCLKSEWTLMSQNKLGSALRRIFEILICVFAFRWGGSVSFDKRKYAASVSSHTDYRKYDDMLRLILDCTIEQAELIKNCLMAFKEDGELFFGIHESDRALMTCFVEDLGDGGHLHFIDGDGGGYAVAARNLKDQIESAR